MKEDGEKEKKRGIKETNTKHRRNRNKAKEKVRREGELK
jgi:hypothetical protein